MIRHISAFILTLSLFLIASPSNGQQAPFSKGVNLTQWFQWFNDSQNLREGMRANRYTKQDFQNIKSLGCDVIRLPIKLHSMTRDSSQYELDPLFFRFLDRAVNYAEEVDIHLIIDNHSFDPQAATTAGIEDTLLHIWPQIVKRYKDRSNLIHYEILNEPHGIGTNTWNTIQRKVIDTIRSIDQTHSIIVSPANYSPVDELSSLPEYNYSNLIYNFHFYEPFLFTHQGAGWTDPSLDSLGNIPFPHDADSMPALPGKYQGTWIESAYNNYNQEGTAQHIKDLLDQAVQFRNNRNVPVFCGEFGVYMPNSRTQDRVAWYDTVQSYMSRHNIAWTAWDYHGGFGIFEKESDDQLFDHHLNEPLLQALGFNVPPQSPYVRTPDSSGFRIYGDFIGPDIRFENNSEGKAVPYNADRPAQGNHCLLWTGAQQYRRIHFNFMPDKDLSYLKEQDYALSMMVRSNRDTASVDVRFTDTDTGSADHPWRMNATIDSSVVPMDGQWHHVYVPLKDFQDQGAWEDGQWYTPQGEFDWSAVDYFAVDPSEHDMQDIEIRFDNIYITNTDTGCFAVDYSAGRSGDTLMANASGATYQWLDCEQDYAKVTDSTGRTFVPSDYRSYAVAVTKYGCTDTSGCRRIPAPTGILNKASENFQVKVWPNPARENLRIRMDQTQTIRHARLYNASGQKVAVMQPGTTRHFTFPLNGLSQGLYLLEIATASDEMVCVKVVKE